MYRARKIQKFLSQPFKSAEVFTGMTGKFVPLEENINGFKAILAGEYDQYNEAAFFMVGGINEVKAKAERMAAETKSLQEDVGAAAAGQAVRKGRLTWDEVFERAKAYRQKVEAHAIKLEPAKEAAIKAESVTWESDAKKEVEELKTKEAAAQQLAAKRAAQRAAEKAAEQQQ